jgi:ketosteroid isomerase-like protein
MSIEENKQLALEFIDRFTANDIAGALDLMSEDATWWIAGKPDHLPAAGLYNKGRIGKLLYNMVGQLPGGLRMTVQGLIAEGDKVALEVESLGELRNGRIYNQQYHFLITVRAGKISGVKEYLDTQHVFAIWFEQ